MWPGPLKLQLSGGEINFFHDYFFILKKEAIFFGREHLFDT